MKLSPLSSPEPSELNSPTSTAQSSRSSSPVQIKSPDDISVRVCYANLMPGELMYHVVDYLSSMADLINFMLVQRRWFNIGVKRFWSRPDLTSYRKLEMLTSVLNSNSLDTHQLVDYSSLIKRLNFAHISADFKDGDLYAFLRCKQVKRLAIPECSRLTSHNISLVVRFMPHLQSVDLQDVPSISDEVIASLVENCPEIQLFYGGGDYVTNKGILQLLKIRHSLKRLRLSGCPNVSCAAVVELSKQCTQLIELDIGGMTSFKDGNNGPLPETSNSNETSNLEIGNSTNARPSGFTEADFREIVSNCSELREIRMDGSLALNPLLNNFSGLSNLRLDNLRVLSLSRCALLNDSAVARIVLLAPNIRQLNISKCPLLTDRTMKLVAETYNNGLQYIHLGHCSKVTDLGLHYIGKYCKRLTFFDANTCPNLTSRGLAALAKIPKLQRIGAVKCPGIGSIGVVALAFLPRVENRVSNIQRLHLSYCLSIGIESIKALLDNCPRLVHISLTGVREFMRSEFLQLSRPAPSELTEHQRNLFCVFSGSGVADLRLFLNSAYESPEAWRNLLSPIPNRSQTFFGNGTDQNDGIGQDGQLRGNNQRIDGNQFMLRNDAREQNHILEGNQALLESQVVGEEEIIQRITGIRSLPAEYSRRLVMESNNGETPRSVLQPNSSQLPLAYHALPINAIDRANSSNSDHTDHLNQIRMNRSFNWMGPRPLPTGDMSDIHDYVMHRSREQQLHLMNRRHLYQANQMRQASDPHQLNSRWTQQLMQLQNGIPEYTQPFQFVQNAQDLRELPIQMQRNSIGLLYNAPQEPAAFQVYSRDDTLVPYRNPINPAVNSESLTYSAGNLRLDG